MAQHDEIEKDQYKKIAELTAEVKTNNGRVEQLSASVDVTNQLVIKQMEQSSEEHKASMAEMRAMYDSHVKMTKWFIGALIVIIIVLILALAYGAIGERGMYAVRETMPSVIQQGNPRSPAVPIPDGSGSQDAAIAPVPVNDLEKYINTKMKG